MILNCAQLCVERGKHRTVQGFSIKVRSRIAMGECPTLHVQQSAHLPIHAGSTGFCSLQITSVHKIFMSYISYVVFSFLGKLSRHPPCMLSVPIPYISYAVFLVSRKISPHPPHLLSVSLPEPHRIRTNTLPSTTNPNTLLSNWGPCLCRINHPTLPHENPHMRHTVDTVSPICPKYHIPRLRIGAW